jgi:hypothetical protein
VSAVPGVGSPEAASLAAGCEGAPPDEGAASDPPGDDEQAASSMIIPRTADVDRTTLLLSPNCR